jgi:GntR family transcriptional regulator, phosphonate transport system regulatory protein
MSTPSRSASGYSTWRLIAEELHREIADGVWPEGARLPTESELSERFGVNRNTVRQAVGALAADGLVASRRGSGTYVSANPVLVHRIGARTRLSASMGDPRRSGSRVLEWAIEDEPPAEVAARLVLDGHPALRMETVGSIDGLPLSRATHWFDAERVPGFVEHYRRTPSITAALRAVGVDDYLRATTLTSARHATVAESSDLGMPAGSVVLVTRAVDALPDGTPLHYVVTRWVANRVELDFEPPVG